MNNQPLNDHEWADEVVEATVIQNCVQLELFEQYFVVTKACAIVLAKTFELTAEDLK